MTTSILKSCSRASYSNYISMDEILSDDARAKPVISENKVYYSLLPEEQSWYIFVSVRDWQK